MEGRPSSFPIPFFLPLPLRERAGVRGLYSQDVPTTTATPTEPRHHARLPGSLSP